MERVFNVCADGCMMVYDLYDKGRLDEIYDTPTLEELSLDERYEWYLHMIVKNWFTEAMEEALIEAYHLDLAVCKNIKEQREKRTRKYL